MSKIVCDICGTSYPETATQCPICGCVRPSDVTVVAGDTSVAELDKNNTYTYVKGGRFSKSNVRRRTQQQNGVSHPQMIEEQEEPKKSKGGRDTGLVVAVCVLLLAIVSAVIYIAIHFFGTASEVPGDETNWQDTTTNTTITTVATTDSEVQCTEILVSKTSLEFTAIGDTCELVVTKNPTNTTNELVFTSSDELVAKVSSSGKIEAVGAGEAVIKISCGNAIAECKVVCKIESQDTTESTEGTTPNVAPEETTGETPEETTEATTAYKISHEDVTLKLDGEAHMKSFKLTLTDSSGNVMDVDWIVGDPSVCEVSGNTVKALKPGYTKVKVTLEDVTYVCIVRVA